MTITPNTKAAVDEVLQRGLKVIDEALAGLDDERQPVTTLWRIHQLSGQLLDLLAWRDGVSS